VITDQSVTQSPLSSQQSAVDRCALHFSRLSTVVQAFWLFWTIT